MQDINNFLLPGRLNRAVEGELSEEATTEKSSAVRQEGNRKKNFLMKLHIQRASELAVLNLEFEERVIQMEFEIIRLTDRPEIKEQAAQWFHDKWGIPLEAYRESMEDCLTEKNMVPQWYIALEKERIIGGLGVIENDFHDRKDLAPNVCAVYTEEDRRCSGVAGALLNYVCADMKKKGIDTLYLVTDHTSFYERYGWEFLCMVQGEGEPDTTRMYIHRA